MGSGKPCLYRQDKYAWRPQELIGGLHISRAKPFFVFILESLRRSSSQAPHGVRLVENKKMIRIIKIKMGGKCLLTQAKAFWGRIKRPVIWANGKGGDPR